MHYFCGYISENFSIACLVTPSMRSAKEDNTNGLLLDALISRLYTGQKQSLQRMALEFTYFVLLPVVVLTDLLCDYSAK